MKIAAIGRTRMLYETIEKVVEQGYDVPIIVTHDSQPEYEVDSGDFERLAEEIGAEFHHTLRVDTPDFRSSLADLNCDIAISINWVTVLSESFLNVFDEGVLNAHAGDLPRYRGNATPNWTIVNGEDEIVLTVHKMVPELDAGPILLQDSKPLTAETTIGEIYNWLHQATPRLLGEAVDKISTGDIAPRPQSATGKTALRTYPRKPKDSELDWTRSAEYLDRVVRASSEPFFGAFTYIGTEKLKIWRAHPEEPNFETLGTPGQVAERRTEEEEVAVLTGNGFLVLEEVQVGDDVRKKATDVIESARTRLGMDLQSEIRHLRDELDSLKE